LLDIKPYIRDFDMKEDSNLGWIDENTTPSLYWNEFPKPDKNKKNTSL